MTVHRENDSDGECQIRETIAEASNDHSDGDRRVLTDGGQAAMAEPEESDEELDSAGDAVTDADDEESADDESENGVDENDEGTDEDGEPAAPDDERAAESTAAEESEEADDVEGASDDERAAGHADDAEDVYESDETAGVLHLDLDGLFLDLLGLEVNLNEVTLDVSARPGENNLLGNLLSAVSGLLDGSGAMLDKVTSLLRKPGELLRQLPQKATSFLRNLLGIGGEESDDADATPEDEEGTADEGADESPGRLARLGSWLRETLVGLVPGLPIEDLVANLLSQLLEQLIDQLEPESDQPGGDQPDAAQEAA